MIKKISDRIQRVHRHGRMSPYAILIKCFKYLVARITSPVYLSSVNKKGAGCRTVGKPRIENYGRIEFGDHVQLRSVVVPVDIYVGSEGVLKIADSVNLNYGTSIACFKSISLGNRVRFGTYVQIGDSQQHSINNRNEPPPPEPIVVGDDVWLGARSMVMPGVCIGRGSVVAAGAVVTKSVDSFTVVAGVPAAKIGEVDKQALLDSVSG